MRDIIRK